VRRSTLSVSLLAGFVLTACAQRLEVGYDCDPPGAELYEEYTQNTRNLGTCPMTVTYDITDRQKEQGYILIRGVTARWASGASQSVPASKADLKEGYTKEIQIARPRDVPGYDNDARFGRDLESTRTYEETQERSTNLWR